MPLAWKVRRMRAMLVTLPTQGIGFLTTKTQVTEIEVAQTVMGSLLRLGAGAFIVLTGINPNNRSRETWLQENPKLFLPRLILPSLGEALSGKSHSKGSPLLLREMTGETRPIGPTPPGMPFPRDELTHSSTPNAGANDPLPLMSSGTGTERSHHTP